MWSLEHLVGKKKKNSGNGGDGKEN
jgi:hypothetical protein